MTGVFDFDTDAAFDWDRAECVGCCEPAEADVRVQRGALAVHLLLCAPCIAAVDWKGQVLDVRILEATG